jgi:N-acetylglucosaminyldiphosphoundecaprenol N-acetyl-beta-D-mannosaminyltransferase
MYHSTAWAPRLQLMGAELDAVTPDQVMDFIARRTERRVKAVIANHNLHSLYLLRQSSSMQAFFRAADLVQIDSIPLIAWGRLLGLPLSRAHRSTYLDWRDRFWALAAERGWRVYLLGSRPGVVEAMQATIQAEWPGAIVAGHHGYFDQQPSSHENRAVVAEINAFRPDVVLVAMGMPLQETWIHANLPALERGVFLSVGGAFDYEVGVQAPAPRWLGALGLEWLFRFACQPRRLFGRYFLEPWALAGPALQDLKGGLRRRTTAWPA